MWRRLLFVLGALLLAEPSLAVSRRDVVAIEKKKPTRSPEAVRKATRQAVTGYQGHSTTKGKPYASAKGELEPSHMSRQKWTDSQIERRGWQEDGLILTVPFWLCVCVYLSACLYRVVEKKKSVSRRDVLALEKKKPTRSPEAVRKATRQSMSGYQGGSTTKKKA